MTRYFRSALRLSLIALLGLLPACVRLSSESTTGLGGSVYLDQALEVDPFYNPIIQQALIDSRLLSSRPLASFDPTGSPGAVVDASIVPIGQLGDLQLGAWMATEETLGLVECIGFSLGTSSGARCGEDPPVPKTPEVSFELACRSGEPEHWWVYTIDERIDALRLNFEDDIAVVGDDPRDTGLVAAEGIGTLVGAAAQTTTGQVWNLDIAGAACPTP